jgi:hypothetical protein
MGGVGRARRDAGQQLPELLQRRDRHDWRADGQGRARRGIGHPGGQGTCCAVRQLAKQHLAGTPRDAAPDAGRLAVQRVPAVVNGDLLRSLGRM